MRLQTSEIKQKQKNQAESRLRRNAAENQNSTLHLHHLEVLHAKFHDRATSNLGDEAETKKIRPLAPLAQRGRKSKIHSAHAHVVHLEVLHAKFHDRATSNVGD